MPAAYRPVAVEDVPALFAVRLATRENVVTLEEMEKRHAVTPASVADGLRNQVRGWLCEDDGQIVGFALGDGETGEVLVVALLPAWEGRGIGKALLQRVRDWLFACGHEQIWLLANPDPAVRASGFYRRLGWRPTGARRGEDQVLRLRRCDACG